MSFFHSAVSFICMFCSLFVSVYSLRLGSDRQNDATIIHFRTSSLINYVTSSTFLPFVIVCCCHRNNRRDTHTSSFYKLLLELDDQSLVVSSMERAEHDFKTAREIDCSRMHRKVSCQVTSKPRDWFSRYSKE